MHQGLCDKILAVRALLGKSSLIVLVVLLHVGHTCFPRLEKHPTTCTASGLSVVRACQLFVLVSCSCLSVVRACQLFVLVSCSCLSVVRACQLFVLVSCSCLSVVHACPSWLHSTSMTTYGISLACDCQSSTLAMCVTYFLPFSSLLFLL